MVGLPEKQLQLGEDDVYLSLQNAWSVALDVLAEQVNKPSFESWIKTAHPMSVEGDLVRIGTTSRFAKHFLESKHLSLIADTLEAQLNRKVRVEDRASRSDRADHNGREASQKAQAFAQSR